MSFDGEYKRENPEFETIENAWNYADDLGSKWFFYPFLFVVSGNRIIDTPDLLSGLKRKQIKTIQKIFNQLSKMPEMEGADYEEFAFNLHLITI